MCWKDQKRHTLQYLSVELHVWGCGRALIAATHNPLYQY